MKKTVALIAAILMVIACIVACKSAPNPHEGPELTVDLPELFTPDAQNAKATTTISIAVDHPVPIDNWRITIQPRRQGSGTGSQQQADRQPRPEGEARQRSEGEAPRQRRAPFFEQTGTKNPPKNFQWNGRGTSGELVQSAMDYRFDLTVHDIFGNASTFEGIIPIGIIVIQDGDVYRMAVPSIVFPPNSADFSRLSEDERRANTRVLSLVARALDRFEEYKITVEGHANPTTAPGTPARTTEEEGTRTVLGLKPLSEQRAGAVVDHLVTINHISRDRLTATGAGGARTIAEWDDEDENWKNRRVEFILQK